MNIHLIRHGQSYGNVDSSYYHKQPDYSIGLTDLGKKQAAAAGAKISNLIGDRPFSIVHSPFLRAMETASIIDAQCILDGRYAKIYESPLLYERSWGNLRYIIDTAEFKPDIHFNFFYRPIIGESFADAYTRVVTFMQEVRAGLYENEDLVIVGHGEWIRLAQMYLNKETVESFNNCLKFPHNCEIISEQM